MSDNPKHSNKFWNWGEFGAWSRQAFWGVQMTSSQEVWLDVYPEIKNQILVCVCCPCQPKDPEILVGGFNPFEKY